MKSLLIAFSAVTLIAAAPGAAEARSGGCVKYGVGGAILGHFAGGHGLAGAAAGCAVGAYKRGHDERTQYDRQRGSDTYDDTTGSVDRRRQDRRYGY